MQPYSLSGRLLRLFRPNVDKMKTRKNVNGLIKLLTDRDAELRASAATALGELAFPRVVVPLCRAMPDADPAVRLAVIAALVRTRDDRAIEPLVHEVRSDNAATARAAAEGLVSFGGQAVNSLSRLLTEREPHARARAIRALALIRDDRIIPALTVALEDPSPEVRITLAETCTTLDDPQVLPLLLHLLRDTDPSVVQAAIAAIDTVGLPGNPADQAVYAVARRDWVRAVMLGSAAVDALTVALTSPDEEVRREAARSLGLIGDPRGLRPLAAALQDARWFVRETAALALGRLKDPTVMEVLIATLRDHSAGAREAAAKALGEIGDPRAIGPLINVFRNDEYYLKNDEYYVCEAAAEALAKFGTRAVEPLVAALKDSRSTARHYIAKALDKTGVPGDDLSAQAWHTVMKGDWEGVPRFGARAIDPLIAALSDDDHRTRRAAAEALGRIEEFGTGLRAIPALCETLRDRKVDVRRAAAEVLVKFGQPAVDPLIFSLNDDDAAARQVAAWALGRIGDPWCVSPLCDALHDPDAGVAYAAAEALDLLGVPDDPEVLAWYAVARQDWDGAVGLGDAAIAPLIKGLTDVSPDVRWASARCLGLIGNPLAAEPLQALLQDDVPYVREAAAHALGYVVAVPVAPAAETGDTAGAVETAGETAERPL